MGSEQDGPSPYVLASKPSASFSSVSSAASATSAATSRSGGSKLLFGEIDTNSERSFDSYASVCSFVLCDSGTFLKFWLDDRCRQVFLSHVPRRDLASLRLACHDFSVRAAPPLFSKLGITFRTSTFTRPTRLAALDRLGVHVKVLSFYLPHTTETFLPPLVEPETGAELSFTYAPQTQASAWRRPKYGDVGTTEILTRQYPALFHAATNVPAFVRAFSTFINLKHLKISCPGYSTSTRYRRSSVDFALISLRIAVERSCLNALDTLTLSPIHPGGLLYLLPTLSYGATPRSASRWSRIQHLTIDTESTLLRDNPGQPDHFRILQAYLRNFQANLTTFHFRWYGDKGAWPIQRLIMSETPVETYGAPETESTLKKQHCGCSKGTKPLNFPRLVRFEVDNVRTPASEISAFVEAHKRTIEDLNLDNVELTSGTWNDALIPLMSHAGPRPSKEVADIPIMLSPTTAKPPPAPMERVQPANNDCGRRSMRLSRWLSTKNCNPITPRKVKEGLQGCEEHLKKVLKGAVLSWR